VAELLRPPGQVVGLRGLGVRPFAGEDFTVVTLEQFAQDVAGALWGGEMVLLVEGVLGTRGPAPGLGVAGEGGGLGVAAHAYLHAVVRPVATGPLLDAGHRCLPGPLRVL